VREYHDDKKRHRAIEHVVIEKERPGGKRLRGPSSIGLEGVEKAVARAGTRETRTIADVKTEAAREIAALAGVTPDKVHVDIRILD